MIALGYIPSILNVLFQITIHVLANPKTWEVIV